MNKRHFIYSLPVILLLIVAVVGWLVKDYLGNKARKEISGESQASVVILSIPISSTLNTLKGAVKSLAGSPWIAPALMNKREQDIEHANSALDRYNSSLNAFVAYLIDADGLTVASANRNDPDSFVGKSYRFRPTFQKAAQGKADHYLHWALLRQRSDTNQPDSPERNNRPFSRPPDPIQSTVPCPDTPQIHNNGRCRKV